MSSPAPASAPALLWDVFCRVVDNFGDIGVCWRLARQLGERGQHVRLWVDDAAALRWMAPDGDPAVEVHPWQASTMFPEPGDVVVEAFGCDPAPEFVAAMARAARAPVWINLEYLSAEAYVERSHGLASPHASGLAKWFFYPGFTARTGGLLREPGLAAARSAFDRAAWLAAHDVDLHEGERLVALFCYPGAPVERLLAGLADGGAPALVATAPGAATGAVRAALPAGGPLRQLALPWLAQDDFDRLLWAADLNVVRGEDSWVRAHWAGKPFVWQAYPQHDHAHAAKIQAFLDRALQHADAEGTAALRAWTAAWNGLPADGAPPPAWDAPTLAAAGRAVAGWRDELLAQPDLVTRLLAFVHGKR
jgi:uncharacterized repeat protein (TIGR03837 family)